MRIYTERFQQRGPNEGRSRGRRLLAEGTMDDGSAEDFTQAVELVVESDDGSVYVITLTEAECRQLSRNRAFMRACRV